MSLRIGVDYVAWREIFLFVVDNVGGGGVDDGGSGGELGSRRVEGGGGGRRRRRRALLEDVAGCVEESI